MSLGLKGSLFFGAPFEKPMEIFMFHPLAPFRWHFGTVTFVGTRELVLRHGVTASGRPHHDTLTVTAAERFGCFSTSMQRFRDEAK